MRKKNTGAVTAALAFTLFSLVLLTFSIGISNPARLEFLRLGAIPAAAQTESDTTTAEDTMPSAEGNDETVSKPILLIDPGHGGEDGGASSADGLLEKDLNLSVSHDIAGLCLLFGIPYEMTRIDDRLLYDKYGELESYEGRKKSLDLKNRLRMADELDTVLFLSIHMNKFPSESVRGFQIYYSTNTADAEPLANSIQSFVQSHVQPYNERAPKAADGSIYLLKNISTAAVLAECGFLSNPDEATLLNTPAYRTKLASAIFVPSAEYFVRCITD